MRIFKNIFKSKNDNFYKARYGLRILKKRLNGFVISFPDITSEEIMFIKDHWEILPKNLANNVKIMALNFNNEIKLLLTSYKPNGYIKSYSHHSEYEYGTILNGSLIDKISGKVYKTGEKYKFKPNQLHYLQSKKSGCLVYSALTSHDKYDLPSLDENEIKLLLVNK